MNQEQTKTLAKQAGGYTLTDQQHAIFTTDELTEFARLVRESAFTDARWAIESANAERHIDVADCVQIIQELK